jgi:hypothetical protein
MHITAWHANRRRHAPDVAIAVAAIAEKHGAAWPITPGQRCCVLLWTLKEGIAGESNPVANDPGAGAQPQRSCSKARRDTRHLADVAGYGLRQVGEATVRHGLSQARDWQLGMIRDRL